LTSFVALEHENSPKVVGPCRATADRIPLAALFSASSQLAGINSPFRRSNGCWSLAYGSPTTDPPVINCKIAHSGDGRYMQCGRRVLHQGESGVFPVDFWLAER
jgi:hypothetical protein